MLTRLRNAALIAALSLTACAPPAATEAPGARLNVVATFSILGDLVSNVGGDQIELTTLVGTDGDAHTFQPSPSDSARLASADLIFENGLGFEPWLDKLYEASASTAARHIVTQGLEARELDEAHAGEEAEHEDEHEHEHGALDPHVWHDVGNVIHMVGSIREALIQADPANADAYRSNAARYLSELEALDQWVSEQTASLPAERRKLVTAHDTFGYFAQRYQFEIVGTALGSLSTEASDPAAADLAALIEEIRASGAPAIFAENVSNPKLMEQIAAEAGIALGPPLYTDALGAPGTAGDTYLNLVRYNVSNIVGALRSP
jgi:ABC-type Zn uptake system ZnuABC Zn-binding protein ZnuA